MDNDNFTRGNLVRNTFQLLPTVDNYNVGSAFLSGATNAEKWMMHPTNVIGAKDENVELYMLPPEVFATLFNIISGTPSSNLHMLSPHWAAIFPVT